MQMQQIWLIIILYFFPVGMRVLDGPVTDAMEAEALTFNNQYIDVYSCCWGPPDDGDNFRKPHPLTTEALETGVTEVI